MNTTMETELPGSAWRGGFTISIARMLKLVSDHLYLREERMTPSH